HLSFFFVHAAHLLGYAYPLDYGEGPLLAQVGLLRSGTPVWRLYANPDSAPYTVVNYPPVYHLATLLAALPLGSVLLAGRLVSLAATLAAALALWLLTDDQRPTTKDQHRAHGTSFSRSSFVIRLLIVLAFLALPIVREWSVTMRADMLGVCLGLWGLVLVRRSYSRRAVLWAALPLALSLLVKPSLIAAPAAAMLWLLFRDWRRALALGAAIGLIGGLATLLLELGSGGWFLLHVLAANANAWDRKLAYGFWHDQMLILWPLVAAAALSALFCLFDRQAGTQNQESGCDAVQPIPVVLGSRLSVLMALYYTLFGAFVAFGVGKVGAYTNYFLEFYAGLVWLAANAVGRLMMHDGRSIRQAKSSSIVYHLSSAGSALVVLLVIGGLVRYYPTWSATYLKLAGIIEGRNPPRLVIGGYGVWQDLRRERDILATLSGVNSALLGEVRAAAAPIFTDVPGVAAQAQQLSRLQVFEYRQLLDAGLVDQRQLLRDLANGRVPLIVLDYLGNWLTPEMIALITHRYAQEGSRGTYDLYRPVDPGAAVATDLSFPEGLLLVGYHLAPLAGTTVYHGGETALLTLDWRSGPEDKGERAESDSGVEIVIQVMDGQGRVVLETTRPLLYGVLPPSSWGGATIQHMQPLALPPALPAGIYEIAILLREGGHELAARQTLASLAVEEPAGRLMGESGQYVAAPLLDAWARLGGDDGPGDPLMPAVPFAGATQQCFVRACLRVVGGEVQQLPLGELVHLADVGLAQAPTQTTEEARLFPQTQQRLQGDFLNYWREHGGEAMLGPPITPELVRGDRIVQYTRYVRLERPIGGGRVRLARLGEEFLRLPGGVTYRWP
ncbi:MAG TPA: DUF2029 domain-containing protein, partial [Roseiflexaceae bacterium]|nr:DUF2029 domain-containing protein [Roseiflexaceae bacterium]